jgi:hypothetical protein
MERDSPLIAPTMFDAAGTLAIVTVKGKRLSIAREAPPGWADADGEVRAQSCGFAIAW